MSITSYSDLASVGLAAPPIHYTGGKRQLLPELLSRVPADIKAYAEPFIGGGALFWELRNRGFTGPALVNDINEKLAFLYSKLRDNPQELMAAVPSGKHVEEDYYRLRDLYNNPNTSQLERAALLLWLSKTCFNGLYRENSKGGMNSPWGHRTEVTPFYDAVILADSLALQNTLILHDSFETAIRSWKLEGLEPKDVFYYLDPPYVPLNPTSSFTTYSKGGFGLKEQEQLAHMCKELQDQGSLFLLSNSDCEITRELYKDFRVESVQAVRRINSKATGRGKISELLVSNKRT